MTNLLEETLQGIQVSGHAPEDIKFIGSANGEYGMTWEQFQVLADREYDSGFGGQEVVEDLTILFKDGQTMWRGEYDGSEWWNFSTPLVPSADPKPITTLFAEWSWDSIRETEERLKEEADGR